MVKVYPRWVKIVIPRSYAGFEEYYRILLDLDGNYGGRVMVTGEVFNMPGHFNVITQVGKNVLAIHDDLFVELKEGEW